MLDAGQLLLHGAGRRCDCGLIFGNACRRMKSMVNEKAEAHPRYYHADAVFKLSNAHASFSGALGPQPLNLFAKLPDNTYTLNHASSATWPASSASSAESMYCSIPSRSSTLALPVAFACTAEERDEFCIGAALQILSGAVQAVQAFLK